MTTETEADAIATRTAFIEPSSLAIAVQARAKQRLMLVRLTQLGLLAVLLGGWELGSRFGFIDKFFYGSPSGIAYRLYDWVENGTAAGPLWQQISVTLEEAVLGFFYGVTSGVVLGVLLGEIPFVADVLTPYIKAVNALPRIVLGSIFAMSLGLGLTSKVVLASVLVFFGVFFNAFQGVRSVDRNLVSNARILGASRLQVVRHVVIPSAMTWIVASLHVALGLAIIGAIVGEYLGSTHGLGLVISYAQNNFDPDGVFGAMLIIGLLATGAESLMELLEKWLLRWKPPTVAENRIKGV